MGMILIISITLMIISIRQVVKDNSQGFFSLSKFSLLLEENTNQSVWYQNKFLVSKENVVLHWWESET